MSELEQETKIWVEYRLKNNEKILRHFFQKNNFKI